jgi:hypothetical protein
MNEGYIPGKVCLRAVASILAERRAALERVLDHADAATHAREGRQGEIDMLKSQLRKMGRRLLKSKVITRVDPAIVGLLCAWATGHDGALAVLEDYLAATGHAQAERSPGRNPMTSRPRAAPRFAAAPERTPCRKHGPMISVIRPARAAVPGAGKPCANRRHKPQHSFLSL